MSIVFCFLIVGVLWPTVLRLCLHGFPIMMEHIPQLWVDVKLSSLSCSWCVFCHSKTTNTSHDPQCSWIGRSNESQVWSQVLGFNLLTGVSIRRDLSLNVPKETVIFNAATRWLLANGGQGFPKYEFCSILHFQNWEEVTFYCWDNPDCGVLVCQYEQQH